MSQSEKLGSDALTISLSRGLGGNLRLRSGARVWRFRLLTIKVGPGARAVMHIPGSIRLSVIYWRPQRPLKPSTTSNDKSWNELLFKGYEGFQNSMIPHSNGKFQRTGNFVLRDAVLRAVLRGQRKRPLEISSRTLTCLGSTTLDLLLHSLGRRLLGDASPKCMKVYTGCSEQWY